MARTFRMAPMPAASSRTRSETVFLSHQVLTAVWPEKMMKMLWLCMMYHFPTYFTRKFKEFSWTSYFTRFKYTALTLVGSPHGLLPECALWRRSRQDFTRPSKWDEEGPNPCSILWISMDYDHYILWILNDYDHYMITTYDIWYCSAVGYTW